MTSIRETIWKALFRLGCICLNDLEITASLHRGCEEMIYCSVLQEDCFWCFISHSIGWVCGSITISTLYLCCNQSYLIYTLYIPILNVSMFSLRNLQCFYLQWVLLHLNWPHNSKVNSQWKKTGSLHAFKLVFSHNSWCSPPIKLVGYMSVTDNIKKIATKGIYYRPGTIYVLSNVITHTAWGSLSMEDWTVIATPWFWINQLIISMG